jgi:hypothetical protein
MGESSSADTLHFPVRVTTTTCSSALHNVSMFILLILLWLSKTIHEVALSGWKEVNMFSNCLEAL